MEATDFDAAVDRLCELLEGDESVATPRDLGLITEGLTRFIRASFWGLPPSEAEDLVQEALIRFMQAVRSGVVDRRRRPAAYLTAIARNLAISNLRGSPLSRALSVPPSGLDDDEIAALLDATADSAAVQGALSVAARRGDHTAVRVVAAWLDLASRFGRSPSSREVAQAACVSHTAVRQCLARFKHYFPERQLRA